MEDEIRAIFNLKFSIPEKNHLKVLAGIVDILQKEKTRDFEFVELKSNTYDGFLAYDQEKQPEINPKKMVAIRKKSSGKNDYKIAPERHWFRWGVNHSNK